MVTSTKNNLMIVISKTTTVIKRYYPGVNNGKNLLKFATESLGSNKIPNIP